MAIFTDDFNRADGAVGAAWAGQTSSWTIDGNRLKSVSGGYMYPAGADDTGDQSIQVDIYTDTFYGLAPTYLYLKHSSTTGDSFYLLFDDSGTNYVAAFWQVVSGNPTQLATVTNAGKAGPFYTVKATYSDGVLTAYVDGTQVLQTTHSGMETNPQYGIYCAAGGWYYDNFEGGQADAYLEVTPSEVYAGNPLSGLAVILHNAEWSDVDPPSSTLSVDHGWLVFQTMETTTRINISWQSVTYVGTVTVTDSEYGATGTFYSSGTPVEGGTDSWPLTEDGATLLNNTGDYCPEGRILTTCEPVDQEGTVKITDALDAILEQLGGYSGQVGPDIGAVSLPSAIYGLFEKTTPDTYYTADEILGLLGGTPTLYSHADLNTSLGNVYSSLAASLADLSDKIDAISAPDLSEVLAAISALSTQLTDGLAALNAKVDALSFASQASVDDLADKLDLIQPSTDVSLSSLNVNEASISADTTSLLTLIGILMGGESMLTIQMVLDAIEALAAAEGSSVIVPPVWPGVDGVTLGTPVAFDSNVDVTADMDGVLVNLTQSPTKTGHYILGNVDLWYGLGRISFESDNGDVEPWQYLAFDNGIFVPKTMAHASAVHLQVLGGAEGTVTPWTITPPAPAPAVATADYPYQADDDDPAGC